jgi:hypothetical protein
MEVAVFIVSIACIVVMFATFIACAGWVLLKVLRALGRLLSRI